MDFLRVYRRLINNKEYEDNLIKAFLLIGIFFLPFIIAISHLCSLIALFLFINRITKQQRLKELINIPLDYFIIAFFAVSLLSGINLFQPYASVKSFISNILTVLAVTVWYFIIKDTLKNKEDIKQVIWVLLYQGLILAIYGIFEYVSGINSRVYSFTGNPNTLPNYFIVTIPLILAVFLATNDFKKKLLILVSVLLILVCLLLTFSRGGWVGFALTLITFTILINKKLLPWFLGVSIFSLFVLPNSITDRVLSIFTLNDSNIIQRIYIWKSAWGMFWANPIDGIGLGQFRFIYPYYKLWFGDSIQPHAHNMIIQKFVELGTLGGVILLGLIVTIFKSAWSHLKKQDNNSFNKTIITGCIAGLLGIIVHGFFDDPLYDDGTFILIWFNIGLIGSIINRYTKMDNIGG